MATNGKNHFFNTIDWYIIRKILTTYFVTIFLLVFVIILIDSSGKIDDFIEHNAPMKAVIFDYYLNIIPYYVNLFGHLIFFISIVFVTSKLTINSEIISILCGGISFNRILRPFIASSIVIGLFALFLSNVVIPIGQTNSHIFEQKYYRNKFINSMRNIHIQTSNTTQLYIQYFDNSINTGYNFTKEIFDNNKIKEKITADIIVYDSNNQQWKMSNWTKRIINDNKETLIKVNSDSIILLDGIVPNDFNNILQIDALTYNQLNKNIVRERQKGTSKVRDLLIEKYTRLFNPIAYIILTFIGVSLSCKKTRGGMGLNLAIGIALAFSLILIMKIFKVFATNGNLTPILAIIIPLIIYFIIAIILLKKAPK